MPKIEAQFSVDGGGEPYVEVIVNNLGSLRARVTMTPCDVADLISNLSDCLGHCYAELESVLEDQTD